MKEENRKKRGNGWIFALALVLALAGSFRYLSGYSSVSGNINGKESPICSVETKEKKVALTFDVAWGNEDIRRILDILEGHGIRGTFFLTGEWAEKYPEEVLAIREAGHDLANHSQSHRSMMGLAREEQKREILSVHERILELTGVEMRLFRAPYDNYDDRVIRNIQACGYYPIQWSVDTGGIE